MSVKQWSKLVDDAHKSELDDYKEAVYAVASLFPNLVRNVFFPPANFRGLSIGVGSRGGYLGIAKIVDSTGEPSILFANGEDPLKCLMELERRVGKAEWKTDTRSPEYIGNRA